jgi:hypothetical protein
VSKLSSFILSRFAASPEEGGMLGSLASSDRGGTTTRANLFA